MATTLEDHSQPEVGGAKSKVALEEHLTSDCGAGG